MPYIVTNGTESCTVRETGLPLVYHSRYIAEGRADWLAELGAQVVEIAPDHFEASERIAYDYGLAIYYVRWAEALRMSQKRQKGQ